MKNYLVTYLTGSFQGGEVISVEVKSENKRDILDLFNDKLPSAIILNIIEIDEYKGD